VGQIVADLVVRPVDRLPVPGRLDLVQDIELVSGGCASNTACVLAKLGAPVKIWGLVGADALADTVLAIIAGNGVDVSCVERSEKLPTSAVLVLVDSRGQRSFLYRPGCNEAFRGGTVMDEALRGCGIVHIGGAMKLLELDLAGLLQRARGVGALTSLDTDWDPAGNWLGHLGPSLPFLDLLLTNEEEGEQLTGQRGAGAIGARLLQMGPKAVVVKQGERGATLVAESGARHFPAIAVEVVDTTCAGDAFVAGFLFGVKEGFSVERCMTLANAAGGLCTTRLSHHGVESLDAAIRFMGSQGPS
jgi:sugar/nucleoside kinase (ribokinase family)